MKAVRQHFCYYKNETSVPLNEFIDDVSSFITAVRSRLISVSEFSVEDRDYYYNPNIVVWYWDE